MSYDYGDYVLDENVDVGEEELMQYGYGDGYSMMSQQQPIMVKTEQPAKHQGGATIRLQQQQQQQ